LFAAGVVFTALLATFLAFVFAFFAAVFFWSFCH